MSTLYICETSACVEALIAERLVEDRLIVSWSAEASAALELAGIEFFELRSFQLSARPMMDDQQRLELYLDVADRVSGGVSQVVGHEEIVRRLLDPSLYLLKIALDVCLLNIWALQRLEVGKRVRVFAPAPTPVVSDSIGLISSSCSLLGALLAGLPELSPDSLVHWKTSVDDCVQHPGTSFGQFLHPHRVGKLARRLYSTTLRLPLIPGLLDWSTYRYALIRSKSSKYKRSIIGWNSREVKALCDSVRSKSAPIVTVRSHFDAKCRPDVGDLVVGILKSDQELRRRLTISGTDCWIAVEPVIRFLADRVTSCLSRSRTLEKRLRKLNPSLILVDSMSPFNADLAPLRVAATRAGIQMACWMHGGYGANESAAGYDVVDLRLSDVHIVYGQVTKRLLEAASRTLRSAGAVEPRKVVIGGSPFLESRFLGLRVTSTRNSVRRIALLLGPRYARNQFYFGYPRFGVEDGLWRENLRLVEYLDKLGEAAEVIVKDYPTSDQMKMWKYRLSKTRLKYVSNELTIEEVLLSSDLVLTTWISTTFFQALISGTPVVVWDDGDIREDLKRQLIELNVLVTDLELVPEVLDYWLSDQKLEEFPINPLREMFLEDSQTASVGILDELSSCFLI